MIRTMSPILVQSLVLAAFGLIFSGAVLLLARRGHLAFRFFVGWIGVGLIAICGSGLMFLLVPVAERLGLTPAAIGIFLAVVFPFGIALELTATASKQQQKLRDLAETVALLSDQVSQLESTRRSGG